jgi:hypothetical protein
MTKNDAIQPQVTESGMLGLALNILASPSEAFSAIHKRPSKLFPLALICLFTMVTMFWYFNIVDYGWYIDDTIAGNGSMDEEQQEVAREAMGSISQNTMMYLGTFGSVISLVLIYVLQAGYLSLASAINGDKNKFTHWFSLVCWTSLPSLLSVLGMMVNIAISPNGQLSVYDLSPLTLTNLGLQSSNGSVQTLMNSLNLTMIWSVVLIIIAYKQWLGSSMNKALGVVLAPYILIFSTWAYFALT